MINHQLGYILEPHLLLIVFEGLDICVKSLKLILLRFLLVEKLVQFVKPVSALTKSLLHTFEGT